MSTTSADHRQLVALLFTDMVGSTQLKQDLGDREGLALIQRHHTFVRETLRAFRDGQEISTAGDSFFLVFGNPSDAVRFALLLHVGLRALTQAAGRPLFDRIGIHVGEVFVESGEGSLKPKDLHGIQVDTCSRLMSLAKANQILMTRSVFDNARQVLRGQDLAGVGPLAWMNHGPYLLKGVEEPLEICEVGEASAGPMTPPPTSEKGRRHASADEEPVLGWRPALEQLVPNTRWLLERKLGEGGFGEVWLGRDDRLKERRVFKFCFRADRVRSLKREVTLFRLLKDKVGQHPNIVGIQEVFFDAPPFYIVMDYAEATDLRAWCEAQGGGGKVPLATRLEIVAQMADALQAAHDAGVIHRDVKPSNILVATGGWMSSASPWKTSGSDAGKSGSRITRPSDGERGDSPVVAKLTDFGIGQVVSQEALAGLTKLGFTQTMMGPDSSSHTGTQLYMAPELLAGKPASTRSDIYSLGVVLYQLLIGDFGRPLTIDWARAINDPLLREDLQKCLAGDPQERFANVGQLAASLRELERRLAELAARKRAAALRRQMRTAAVALLIIATLLGLVKYVVSHNRIPPATHFESLAVLPFSYSGDAGKESFADGMTDLLIGNLSKISSLKKVSPRTSVFQYQGTKKSLREISQLLGVDAVLEGTVVLFGNQISLSARLFEGATEQQMWTSEPYTDDLTNIFKLQSKMALAVAQRINVKLLPQEQVRLAKARSVDAEALHFYLEGSRHGLNHTVEIENRTAIQLLQRATAIDPDFAVAWAALALAFVDRVFYIAPGEKQTETNALVATETALKLDPDSAEAHFARGYLLWTHSRGFPHEEALNSLLRAVDLNPRLEEAYRRLELLYVHIGLFQESYEAAEKAAALNPSANSSFSIGGDALLYQGNYEQALAVHRKFEKTPANNILTGYRIAWTLFYLKRKDEAFATIKEYSKKFPKDNQAILASTEAILFADAGDEANALDRINSAAKAGKGLGHFHHSAYNIASAYALLNKPTEALDWLRNAAVDGYPCYPWFERDPNLNNLRQDPRFIAFMAEQKKQHARFQAKFGKSSRPPVSK